MKGCWVDGWLDYAGSVGGGLAFWVATWLVGVIAFLLAAQSYCVHMAVLTEIKKTLQKPPSQSIINIAVEVRRDWVTNLNQQNYGNLVWFSFLAENVMIVIQQHFVRAIAIYKIIIKKSQELD